ncbi:ATP-binding protein [Desulfallas thermosapovorans]|uniref:AAA+ ATPase domain-containing protein n=1 Tax=Desulfallas thermosapovorans DSM 6562 TaxID=1121431 RepID=A0A5S4ZPP3_9FIRM|nr:ATP-binding protein [Desulfallas thermosapovorans]TYO94687.1 hypothetical protein LX24_02154 [Desulfallas thermosapovorans DSM 6562]
MLNFQPVIEALPGLTVYRNILKDPIVKSVIEHLLALANPTGTIHPVHSYGRVYHMLAMTQNPLTSSDAWQNHLLELILSDVNPFSRAAYTPGGDYTVFKAAVHWDLSILQCLFEISVQDIHNATIEVLDNCFPVTHRPPLPRWTAPRPPAGEQSGLHNRRVQMKRELAAARRWDKLAEQLAHYYATYGCGIFGRFIAFKWQNGILQGVDRPDPIKLNGLFEYTDIREQVIANTRQFLNGYPANNLLLYGDRGTGKSSTVKALLNEYWSQGLRLVEVPKKQLPDYHSIVQELRHNKHRFILFVDDLSFEENETEFKDLKALLEGGIEDRPGNVLIYATSNRRHLIKETFADRVKNNTGGEIHAMDSVQEKLSLADRFGITVIFPTPDQETFLKIAVGLAEQRGLPLPPQELRQRALHWSMWQNGRSPRSARQFVDQLEGQLAMENGA